VFELYLVIGVIVFVCTYNKMKKIMVDGTNRSSFTKYRHYEGDMTSHIGIVLWGPSIVLLWPLVILYLAVRKED
jgi:hypothetical protein